MMALITIARPEDVDLAVPPLIPGHSSGMTLRQIADGYSKYVTRDWARAVNVEYRAGPSGPSVSLIAEGGTVWTTGDPRWPVMMATKGGVGGVVIKEAPSEAEIKAARWAFSAGPWLVRGGKAADIASEIKRCGFSGLMESSTRERAAIGIRGDGAVVHYADSAMTLYDLAAKMLTLGCRDAINLDGGGSVGVIDPDGRLLIGYSTRQICCALIFKRLMDDAPPKDSQPSQPPQPQPKGGEKMIVCIDPGHGGPDPGCVGPDGTKEKDITLFVSRRAAEYLQRMGHTVVMTRATDTDVAAGLDDKAEMRARGKVSNDAGCEYLVSIHVDTFQDPEVGGFKLFHWPDSVKGPELCRSIAKYYTIATGLELSSISPANYLIFSYADCVTVLIELGFMTNVRDRALLKEPAFLDKCALAIAYGIDAMRA